MLHWLEPTILDVVLDLNNREVQGIVEQARQGEGGEERERKREREDREKEREGREEGGGEGREEGEEEKE